MLMNKNPDEKKKSISVTLNPELLLLLKKYTEKNNKNKSSVIEELLKKYLNKNDEK